MPPSPFQRDNHYVSRGYLKRWEHERGRVWTYRVLVSDEAVPLWKPASTKGVAYREHLYTKIAACGESDEVERWLAAEFESPAEGAIERATTDRRMAPEDWRRLARFFAAQDVRTPASLMESIERWNRELPALIESTMEEAVRRFEPDGQAGRIEGSQKALPEGGLPFNVTVERWPGGEGGFVKGETVAGRSLWLWNLIGRLTRTVTALEKHRWTILAPPEGTTWFTSDNPVLKVNFRGPTDYTFGGGWGSEGTYLMLPLGPHHLLYTQVGRRVPSRGTRMSTETARVVRRLIAEHAHRFVFADSRDPSVPQLRPRVVDAELLRAEAARWARWHEDQTAAERELMGWDAASPKPR